MMAFLVTHLEKSTRVTTIQMGVIYDQLCAWGLTLFVCLLVTEVTCECFTPGSISFLEILCLNPDLALVISVHVSDSNSSAFETVMSLFQSNVFVKYTAVAL